MQLINEQEIRATWAPIIEEATGIQDSEKLNWMSQLCHNHKLYEDSQGGGANIVSLGNTPGPMNINGMGAVSFPSAGGDGSANAGSGSGGSTSTGSGDKAPTLLPLSMQVAGQTVGLDLLPVIPMPGPQGLISYLDFPYEGGRTDNEQAPYYVKVDLASWESTVTSGVDANPTTAKVVGTNISSDVYGEIKIQYDTDGDDAFNKETTDTRVGYSRIDGKDIVRIDTAIDTEIETSLKDRYGDTVELVNALEDHIPGFVGNQEPKTNTGSAPNVYKGANPYSREEGESTGDRLMGLKLQSRQVRADSIQVAAAVTREEIQDLRQYGVDAVAQVESVLTNELTQTINKHILGSMWDLSDQNDGFLKSTNGVVNLGASSNANYGGDTRGDVHRRILTNILAATNFISTKGRRGAGNFAVVDGKVASALQGVSGFVPNPMANTMSQNAGAIYPLGSIAGVNIYTDPMLDFEGIPQNDGSREHPILVGRRGDGNGPGLVFMPYLMAESVETIAEGSMAPKVAVKSRYALVEAGHHPQTQYVGFRVSGLEL
jgi:hypothetical protein